MGSYTSARSYRNVMSGKPKKSLGVATGISLSENKEIASGNWDRSSQPGRSLEAKRWANSISSAYLLERRLCYS